MTTATNPETGEKIALIDGKWTPIQGTATNPETGERLALANGSWQRVTGSRGERSLQEERWRELGNTEPLYPPKEADAMSRGQRFAAGLDKGLEDVAYGAASLFSQGARDAVSQREQDYQLGGLDQYPAGAITGNIAGFMAPGGIGAKVGGYLGRGLPAAGTMLAEGAGAGLAEGLTAPVQGDDYWSQKADQVLTGGGLGLGGTALLGSVLGGGMAVANAPRMAQNVPATLAERQLNRQAPIAVEGRRLADEYKIPMTPGQMTGSPSLIFMEQRARESILSSSRVADGDLVRANKFKQLITDQAGPVDSASFANNFQGKVSNFVVGLARDRSKTGRAMYGEIDRLAGGEKIVQPRNLYDELNAIITEAGSQEGGDIVKAAAQARQMLATIDKQGGYTAQEALSRLQNWSPYSKGTVFDDVSMGYDAVLKRRVYGAMLKDMDETATQGGSLGDMVKAANQKWRDYSEQIGAIQQSALGKMVGEEFATDLLNFNKVAPEQVMDQFMRLRPSQAEYTAKFLKDNMPDELEELQGAILKDSIDAAMQVPPTGGAEAVFNAGAWLRSMGLTGGDRGGESLLRLKSLFGGDKSKAWVKLNDSINIARRMADASGRNFSGTAPANQFYELIRQMSSSLAQVGKTIGSTGLEALGLGKIADSMNPYSAGYNQYNRTRLLAPPRVVQRSPVGAGVLLPGASISREDRPQ
jgi:hypothetical protein